MYCVTVYFPGEGGKKAEVFFSDDFGGSLAATLVQARAWRDEHCPAGPVAVTLIPGI